MDADSQSVCCVRIYVFVRLYECLCLDVPCVGIWALYQAENSTIDNDYLWYVLCVL